jgi:hypothetical protein
MWNFQFTESCPVRFGHLLLTTYHHGFGNDRYMRQTAWVYLFGYDENISSNLDNVGDPRYFKHMPLENVLGEKPD